ncbi:MULTISPECIES: crossover junction endodeoxyribonuclease RuvC [unclassified Neisseria]|uniref:crossover junction endodeoxyribonuclease RuvC n=1 Tax=unclassified Neisseria TaxID=2623750 RepID=UPI001072079B|nr:MULTISPECIES: crossover junction endodeoxyribonuclease RuvC [unclassified Neisseria]MBF0803513.1 crossover junction endodeoxyribonuclease RuvC [Neisseria sp. 19428wB4_WF04]TFU43796.1 crossover junction endodeoxyribonuclease RuvC [Neisseria sp. WF04]
MNTRPTRILGIDPGSRVTGFGVVDVRGRGHFYVASGCIKTPPNAPLAERIAVIVKHIDEIITAYRPQQAAVEQVFVNVNPAATLMLGQARGAALAALVMHGLPTFEYTALQVKQAVVGKGKAAKEQVQHMVVQMLALSGTPQADAADGLAVALTHALRNQGLAAQLQQGSLQIKRGRFQKK